MFSLRPYQLEAVDRVRDAIRRGRKAVILVAPCGSGKTVVASHILKSATAKGRSSLFIAHRRELIFQAANKLKAFGVEHGIMMAGETPSLVAETQVASIQSFTSRVVKRKNVPLPSAEVIVIDESHRSTSDSYLRLKELYPNAVFLGLTATPVRSDGRGLGKFYEEIIEISTPQALIDMGYLVDTRVVAPRLPDLKGLRTVRGDYDEKELEKRMTPLIGDLVRDWKTYAEGRSTLVFAVTVAHSVWIQRKFEDAGIICEHVDAQTPSPKRDRIFKKFSEGKIQIISNVGIATEGTDLPIASCAVMARPTKSYGLYLQCVGRICRPYPGKDFAIILDHSGAVYKHGFPQDAGGWELDQSFNINERKDERLAEKSQPITCRECFTVYSGQLHCPTCGAMPSPKSKSLSMKEGRLYEVKREKKTYSSHDKQTLWNECIYTASHRNLKIGSAAHMYRKKTGVWPRALDKLPRGSEWQMLAREFLEKYKSNRSIAT